MRFSNSADRLMVATAYHEAGHATVATWLGLKLDRVELTPDDPLHTGCCWEKVDDPHALRRAIESGDEDVIVPQIKVLLAGGSAQRKGGYDDVDGGDEIDLCTAASVARLLVGCPSEAQRLRRRLLVETRQLLDLPAVWAGVQALARELLRKGVLDGNEAHGILGQAAVSTLAPERRDGP